jgi:uncharacterized surface protein with fasciclin (FAS1) repeats
MRRGRLVVVSVMLSVVGLLLAGCECCNPCAKKEPACPTKYTKSDKCNSSWSKCRSDGATTGRNGQSCTTIWNTAMNTASLSTFAKALRSAGLVDRFRSGGPYTVFAPSDEAFSRLPAGTLDNLMKPENKDRLRSILLYHVTGGDLFSSDISGSRRISTLEGQPIRLVNRDGRIFVNNARVVEPNLRATNGVIHEIDMVLMPAQKESMQGKGNSAGQQ